jgi:hypothetical protein
MKKFIKILLSIIFLIILSVIFLFYYNYHTLKKPLIYLLQGDSVISSVEIDAHFYNFIDFSTVLIKIENTPDDIQYPIIYDLLIRYSKEIDFSKYKYVLFKIGDTKLIHNIKDQINFQEKLNEANKKDYRNVGIDVMVYYNKLYDSTILVYDLIKVSSNNSMADVFRLFLQFAEKTKENKFDYLILSHKGKQKFKILGKYFTLIGSEYSWQNPIYTIRTFPENLYLINGLKAYSEWSGGWLGVSLKQMEDFDDFHKQWWINDYVK